MSIQTGQLLNATLPAATAFTHRSYSHVPLQNVVFFWTAQRAERTKRRASGSQYWDLINGVDYGSVCSTSIKIETEKHSDAEASKGKSATKSRGQDFET
jgi:hypothetical protein